MSRPAVHLPGGVAEPEGLVDAVLAYEAALQADDVAALDDAFVPGPDTLRGDAAGLLVGSDAIAAFRRGRGGIGPRTLVSLEVRPVSEGAALVVVVVAPASGGRGLLTQLWVRDSEVWRIAAAQVSAPAPAIDTRVWRTVGSPLVAGAASGPLVGETIAVKDLFDIEGFRVGAGNPTWLAEAPVAKSTAPAVKALLDAGAGIRGIAQTDEFAYSIAGANAHYGTPPNPLVPGGLPGGSSSGPASAVASGQASVGLGTDTAGSIRVPASYNGLWGLRTTHNSVSREGLLPLADTFDTVGWLTRSPAVLRAVADTSLVERVENTGGFVVAPQLVAVAEPTVQHAFASAIANLHTTPIDVGDIDELLETFRVVQASEAWRADGDWVTAHPDAVGAATAGRFAIAAAVTPAEEQAARAALAAHRVRLDALLGDRVLLLPSASSAAPSTAASSAELDLVRAATLRLCCIAGLTGRPALSVPLLTVPGPFGGDAPLGLCLVGPRRSDVALIALGEQLAQQLA